MRTIAVKIRFLGAAYHGFQRQKNAVTVQQLLEEALLKILGEKAVVYGCSRTDAGVSAAEYVFHFQTGNPIAPQKIVGALNHLLPPDIGVTDAVQAPDAFHARWAAAGKEYRYFVRNERGKDPFCEGRAFRYAVSHIDVPFLNAQAQELCGRHDFSAFCSAHDGAGSHLRCVTRAEVRREGGLVCFIFAADGFLYNMVRIMVGTLLHISEGKKAPGSIRTILESGRRENAGFTAPACGLYLWRVFYPDDPFKSKKEEKHG